jgi:two-component system response regulator MprA
MAQGNVVLVVDDNPTVTRYVANVLTPLGYQVETAQNGIQGLAQVMNQQVDLIFLDLVMPRMNGYQFCQALEQKKLAENAPIILLTSAREKVAQRVKKTTRAADFLPKPVKADQLQQTVQKYLPLPEKDEPGEEATVEIEIEIDSDEAASGKQELQAILRDRLQNAVGVGLTARLDEIMSRSSFDEVLGIMAEVLDDAVSDELVEELVDRARSAETD